MDGELHSTLEAALISSSGIATFSGAGSVTGGAANVFVVGSAALIDTSGVGCVYGPKTNVSSVIFDDSAIEGDGATGGESTHEGGSADDGRLCSRGSDGSGPEAFS